MFNTLRSKLVFSYVGLSILILALALSITFVLARQYAERVGFESLQQKKTLLVPVLQLSTSENAGGGVRGLVTNRMLNAIHGSGLRLLILDPDTHVILTDTSVRYHAVGQTFPLKDDPNTTVKLDDQSSGGVFGQTTLAGENNSIQFIAARVPVAPFRQGIGPRAPAGTLLSDHIVVFAQPHPNTATLLPLGRDLVLPAVLIALVVSLGVAYFLARSISRPVARLAGGAAAMARGDYDHRLPVEGHDELATLTGQFNVMAEEVGQAHRMQRDFVANISHDLKTPLTSIQGFSQAMLDGSIRDEGQYRQAATIINHEAQRMSRLVSQLLSLSQLQSGLRDIELRPTELGPLLAQLILAMQPQAQAAGVELTARFGETPGLVLSDADRLKQAFGNLIDNALKHTPEGGRVVVRLSNVAEGVEVAVEDTGRGIPASDLPRVMERFYQVDKARSFASTKSLGLGLAITREVVAAHHGQITLESAEGDGTTVRVLLPSGTPDPTTGKLGNGARRKTNPLARAHTPPLLPGPSNGSSRQ